MTRHRGPLLIHAAKAIPDWGRQVFETKMVSELLRAREIKGLDDLPLGGFVGVVTLDDCVEITALDDRPHQSQEVALGDYGIGRYIWRLSRPLRFHEPIPARGQQRLWTWDYSDQPLWIKTVINMRMNEWRRLQDGR